MVSLRTLAELGIAPAFFHIGQPTGTSTFTYYTFDGDYDVPVTSYTKWDIMGIREPNGNPRDPVWADIRLIHIDEDMLDATFWPGFDALRDGSGYVSLDPQQLDALVHFLKAKLPATGASLSSEAAIFSRMDVNDVVTVGVPLQVAEYFLHSGGVFYRYRNRQQSVDRSTIQLVYLSGWSSKNSHTSLMTLSFMAYSAQLILDRTFNPLDAGGIGTLRFDAMSLYMLIQYLETAKFQP